MKGHVDIDSLIRLVVERLVFLSEGFVSDHSNT